MSGTHLTLPVAELRASLEAEGYSYELGEQQGRVILVEVDPQGALIATRRSGFVNYSMQLIFECPMKKSEILRAMNKVDFHLWLNNSTRFGVRVTRIHREQKQLDIEELQGKIGSKICRAMKGKVRVDLEVPEVLFLGLITTARFYFGIFIAARNRREFNKRRSPLRPFFNPDTIHPKIARAMVNLSRSGSGDMFLDPFCGSGGLLLEATSIGSFPIGIDNDHRILWGCRRNLDYFETPFSGICADARNIPFRSQSIDAIATDPPYGRSSSTRKSDIATLLKASLTELTDVLTTSRYICFAIPLEHYNESIIDSKEYSIVEEHSVYVHRSLTRHIVVLKRK